MVTVHLPRDLADLTGGQRIVVVEASNLREVPAALEQSFPGLTERIVDHYHAVVDGTAHSFDTALALHDGAEIRLLMAIAGG